MCFETLQLNLDFLREKQQKGQTEIRLKKETTCDTQLDIKTHRHKRRDTKCGRGRDRCEPLVTQVEMYFLTL